ncbi:DnaB-like helicase C-terminal domain-containing protein [Priestia aryabhattai]|uniref:DnaB-like helicase C-terminal domain-containing protein n=1 Tax=Priestia aryabhattai TaxID=412384 RepID=UPI002E23918B|nr:DnaB-like helicase C-terminal domain-containing protein [Priestia aryabhattai]MED4262012.1 DnaB-like helicase C-terminal domain-containing protein [Priestia aryabhattai]
MNVNYPMNALNSVPINVLNPPRSIYSVIGNLCKNPQALRDPEVVLTEKDFAIEFHQVIFSAIYNLAFSSAETTNLNEIDIDNYLAPYSHLYQIWEKHDGRNYVRDAIEHANQKTFKSNYERLKKFALLRHYVSNGFDISDLYNYTSSDLKEQEIGMKTIDKMSVQEIIEHYSLKMMNVRDSFNVGQESRSFKAGDDLDTLLDDLNKTPEFGYPFKNGFYNAIFRGMRKRKFMLRSAGTGAGKTRQALADICNVACDTLYDYDKGWVSNGPSYPGLFISTELEQQEVQTIMLAFISGVNEQVIKDGGYSPAIRERLEKAIEILKRAPIYCEYVDDFSIADIEMLIERYIIESNVAFVFFDYIQMTPKLSRTMANAFGSNLREDQILVQFAAALKILANKYEVFISSSTQLNRSAKEAENRDTTSLRGGSATADKVDHGLMTFKVTDKDRAQLKHILERGFFDKPNYSHWIYKNRSGRDGIIIWTRMDLGTMRETPLFITDLDYNLITDIEQIEIEYEEPLSEDTNIEKEVVLDF